MQSNIVIEPLTHSLFAPFGDIIDASGEPTALINNDRCERYSDIAKLDFAEGGKAGISVFHGQPYSLPHTVPLMERHPLGSQAFIPMSGNPFLVVVAADESGVPGKPRAFLTAPQQGINIHRGVWHGVLTPLNQAALFTVVDWIGAALNLEEYHFEQPWIVCGT